MGASDEAQFGACVLAYRQGNLSQGQMRQALWEQRIPDGPALAYLEHLRGGLVAPPAYMVWLAEPWEIVVVRGHKGWALLRDAIVLVRTAQGFVSGRDPYWWDGDTSMPRDSRDNPDLSQVPRGLIKSGVWVTDDEMRWTRWLAATCEY
jgi:hypothetical protein